MVHAGRKGILKIKIPTTQIRMLPNSDPRNRLEDVYEIRGLPKKLELIRVETKDSAAIRAEGKTTTLLACISALAMVGLVFYSRTVNNGKR